MRDAVQSSFYQARQELRDPRSVSPHEVCDVEEQLIVDDQHEEEREEEQEAIVPCVNRDPRRPSKEEVEFHMMTHVPYRSWCAHCVRGRAKGNPHRKAKHAENQVPTLVADYMFMHESQSEYEERGVPIPCCERCARW